MLKTYGQILRLPGAWRFSLAGFFWRMPMSMVGISMILLVKAEYGNYATAGLVAAAGVIASAAVAPMLSRQVDRHGQLRVMGPATLVSAASAASFVWAASMHSPEWVLVLLAVVNGATWGSPGAMVRSRWAAMVTHPRDLATAYAFESAIDEFIFIIGPVVSTVLGAAVHPGLGLLLSTGFLIFGGMGFLLQRSTEPEPRPAPTGGGPRTSVLRDPAVIVLALTYIGAGALFGANDVSVVAFTEERGIPAMSGVLLAVFSFGSLLAGLVYGARAWRQPLWKLFAIGILALGAGVSVFLVAPNVWALGVAMLIVGSTCAPTTTNVNMIVARVVPDGRLTEGLTWMTASMNIGVSLGAALAGPVIDHGGSFGGYAVTVAFAWMMVAIALVGIGWVRTSVERAETRTIAELHEGVVPAT
ncbi:MFS transporter [Schaalia sp. 19OD2882]|uniref:MFS transporter n=1 Tax=Schaalia sp. 19OD2882 TaxID=2794089 RepID=UPI001C1E9474|nr:MFS transporter [Schaalia sp. 19OD2882]QWW19452.1 MFS transporter [Schaalia sp. 19OD2882]